MSRSITPNVIIFPGKCLPRFRDPASQITRLVADTWHLSIYDQNARDEQTEAEREEFESCTFDTVVLTQGSYVYCGWLSAIARIVSQCGRVIFTHNDYAFGLPTQIRDAISSAAVPPALVVLSATEEYSDRLLKTAAYAGFPKRPNYINWNGLTFTVRQMVPKEEQESALMYYGTFRPGRLGSFLEYLSPTFDTPVPPIISCSDRAVRKWEDFNNFLRFAPMFNGFADLAHYSHTLYLEDKVSHTMFTSPANRFYECLSAGVAMLFAPDCANTFKRAGIDIGDFIAGPDAVSRLGLVSDTIRTEQRDRWTTRDYRLEMIARLVAYGQEFGLIS